jgi:hypothetical protein
MKSLLEYSCELVVSELKNLVYTYELKSDKKARERFIRNKINVCFSVKELPSSKTPGINQLHLICFAEEFPATYMYLAEIEPATRSWVIEGSSFSDKTRKFVSHCLEILEGRDSKNVMESGKILTQIAEEEFKKLYY